MILRPGDPELERVMFLREQVLRRPDGKRGRLSSERARLATESYRQSEGAPPIVRRALAIAHILSRIAVHIYPRELIAGVHAGSRDAVEVTPEYSCDWLLETIDLGGRRVTELDALPERGTIEFLVEERDRRVLVDEVIPYWRGRSHAAVLLNELRRHHADALHHIRHADVCLPLMEGGLSHTVQDYRTVLARGLDELVAGIRRSMEGLDALHPRGLADFDRRNCYQAMLIVAEGLVAFANRHAAEAERLAEVEPEEARRGELREIARICRKVPGQPAESWWEALQCLHLLHIATALGEGGTSHGVGRIDKYLHPWLRADLESGRITPKRAQELLECLFLKFYERQVLHRADTVRGFPGFRTNDKAVIGGVDREGRDCTNDLSYMVLEAQAHIHLHEPSVSVRLHRHTPAKFLRCTLEVVRLGGGLPLLLNDDAIVPALMAAGVELEDARNYADVGCQENLTDPNDERLADANVHPNAGWFNLPKVLELALFDGVNPLNGERVAPATGDARSFDSMDQFLDAFRRQLEHAVAANVAANNAIDYTFATQHPSPLHDLLHPGPRASGVDISAGGCRYNWTGSLGVGFATAADSLAAIDHLVFKTKQTTWVELLAAIAGDWEEHEDLRRKCQAAPKYGADDEFADGWARRLLGLYAGAFGAHSTPRGGRFLCGLISMGTYLTLGERTGATPDGRARGEPLSDSAAPSRYALARGATATHLSATRAFDPLRLANGFTFNQRLPLSMLQSEREMSVWEGLVRTFVEMGGQTVQYTIVDKDALLDARRHPENYSDLMVRVGGYSALFVELSPEIQDTIIARAELDP